MTIQAQDHGVKAYRSGCRCDECKAAWREYTKGLYAARKARLTRAEVGAS